MVTISSGDQLRSWLSDKPAQWSQAIALRAALRSFPMVAVDKEMSEELGGPLLLPSLGCVALAWAAQRWRNPELAAASAPPRLAWSGARDASSLAPTSRRATEWMRAAESAYAAAAASRCAAADLAQGIYPIYWAATDAVVNAVAASGDVVSNPGNKHDIWHAVEADADSLAKGDQVLASPLWANAPPKWFADGWTGARSALDPPEESWSAWLDFLQRRIDGSTSAFGLAEGGDLAVIRQLSDQNSGFWELPAAESNAQLRKWIEEAAAEWKQPEPEPQNPAALVFRVTADGLVDIDSRAGASEVASDPDSVDRHSALRAAIARGLAQCGANAAAGLRERMARLDEALGPDVGAMRPSLVVLYGEAVRQDVASRQNAPPDSDVPPLPEAAMLSAKEVVSAINMLVGLDEALARRDLARMGPDVSPAQIPPEEVVQLVSQSAARSALTPDARDTLATASELAPALPDFNDRRSRSLSESARNVVRKVAQSLWHYSRAVGVVAAIPAALYGLGNFLLANEATWLRWFADNPTMLGVIEKLVSFLRSLPLSQAVS